MLEKRRGGGGEAFGINWLMSLLKVNSSRTIVELTQVSSGSVKSRMVSIPDSLRLMSALVSSYSKSFTAVSYTHLEAPRRFAPRSEKLHSPIANRPLMVVCSS